VLSSMRSPGEKILKDVNEPGRNSLKSEFRGCLPVAKRLLAFINIRTN
jgi:hypothetical protein